MGVYGDNQLVKAVEWGEPEHQCEHRWRNLTPPEWKREPTAWEQHTLQLKLRYSPAMYSNIQASGGWKSWGKKAPNYNICPWPCSGGGLFDDAGRCITVPDRPRDSVLSWRLTSLCGRPPEQLSDSQVQRGVFPIRITCFCNAAQFCS